MTQSFFFFHLTAAFCFVFLVCLLHTAVWYIFSNTAFQQQVKLRTLSRALFHRQVSKVGTPSHEIKDAIKFGNSNKFKPLCMNG